MTIWIISLQAGSPCGFGGKVWAKKKWSRQRGEWGEWEGNHSPPVPPLPTLHSDSFFLCPNIFPEPARRACLQANRLWVCATLWGMVFRLTWSKMRCTFCLIGLSGLKWGFNFLDFVWNSVRVTQVHYMRQRVILLSLLTASLKSETGIPWKQRKYGKSYFVLVGDFDLYEPIREQGEAQPFTSNNGQVCWKVSGMAEIYLIFLCLQKSITTKKNNCVEWNSLQLGHLEIVWLYLDFGLCFKSWQESKGPLIFYG